MEQKNYLLYNYIHTFKKFPNNWITEAMQQLTFSFEGKDCLACLEDVFAAL